MASNPRLINLCGQRFGSWLVLAKSGNAPRGAALWSCRCDCGNERAVLGGDLRSGKSLSCGCKGSRATIGERVRKHGLTNSRLYQAWQNMRARCDPDKGRWNYGGRGITVCDEWGDFSAFAEWAVASGYSDGMTIERRDVNGNYSPNNCEWIPGEQQAKNKTNSLKAPDGSLWVDVAKSHGITPAAFRCRISAGGWSAEDAATIPLGTRVNARTRDTAGRWTAQPRVWKR